MKWLNRKHSRNLRNAINVNKNIIFHGQIYKQKALTKSTFLGDHYKLQILSPSIPSQSLLRNILPTDFINVTKQNIYMVSPRAFISQPFVGYYYGILTWISLENAQSIKKPSKVVGIVTLKQTRIWHIQMNHGRVVQTH